MNIEGTYKVNIEHTVRKIGESEDATVERMLSYVGLRPSDIPADPKEAKMQKMIADYQKDELATTLRLEIAPDPTALRFGAPMATLTTASRAGAPTETAE
jgi:hypothetical protein